MRIEMKVDWEGLAKPKAKEGQPIGPSLEPPRSRVERRLWYIAVGQEIKHGIAHGQFDSLAHAARECRVSRARICQLFDLPKA